MVDIILQFVYYKFSVCVCMCVTVVCAHVFKWAAMQTWWPEGNMWYSDLIFQTPRYSPVIAFLSEPRDGYFD